LREQQAHPVSVHTGKMSGSALRPNCSFCCWGSPKPLISELKILPELFGKALAFIRFDDYNYSVIL